MDEAFVEVEGVDKDPRLCELSTQWTMLFQAHHGTPEQMSDGIQRIMMLRYINLAVPPLLSQGGGRPRGGPRTRSGIRGPASLKASF